MSDIHPKTDVHPNANIGDNVSIGAFSVISDRVSIGEGCRIGPHVTLLPYTTLGPGCRVHAGAVLGDEPQDLAFEPCDSYVRIGRECIIREGVTIHRGTKPDSETVVGDHCFLMAFSHLAHNVVLEDNVVLANGALVAGYATIGEGTFMGGNAGVHQFCSVGRLVMLGGNAGASKDVPPFVTLASVERNEVAGLNVIGLRRAGFSPDERKAVKEVYKMLYASGLNVSQAVEAAREAFADGPAREFIDFVANSKRGVCRPVDSPAT